jgi:hypothetical protein
MACVTLSSPHSPAIDSEVARDEQDQVQQQVHVSELQHVLLAAWHV